ncbi:MAG: molybdenum cofactor guanylyltransferase [Acidobacteria bacterium]|nr:molybdenum cofactor guanylyltransferase [Acidobacteriota bacterium]
MKGFVLAGGLSTRMGRDKALLPFRGRLLIEHAVELLVSVGLDPHIAGSRPDLRRFAPIVEDLHSGAGPLGGIEAALSNVAEAALFLPVDLPLLPPEFLRLLLARVGLTGAAATIPTIAGQPQPLCAVYSRTLLPRISAALAQGDGKVMRVVTGLRTDLFSVESVATAQENFGLPSPPHQWFTNVNSPDDLARAGTA